MCCRDYVRLHRDYHRDRFERVAVVARLMARRFAARLGSLSVAQLSARAISFLLSSIDSRDCSMSFCRISFAMVLPGGWKSKKRLD
jgi:hypothetical protein